MNKVKNLKECESVASGVECKKSYIEDEMQHEENRSEAEIDKMCWYTEKESKCLLRQLVMSFS